MLTAQNNPTKAVLYNYNCGCVQHIDRTWTLCEDCGARIGKVGTCLACNGPADEWYTVTEVPESRGCSPECAKRDAVAILEGWR